MMLFCRAQLHSSSQAIGLSPWGVDSCLQRQEIRSKKTIAHPHMWRGEEQTQPPSNDVCDVDEREGEGGSNGPIYMQEDTIRTPRQRAN